MSEKEKELNEGELEKAAGGLKRRQVNEPLQEPAHEPLGTKRSDVDTGIDP